MGQSSRYRKLRDEIDGRFEFLVFCTSLLIGRLIVLSTQFPAYVGGDSISYRSVGVSPDSIPSLAYWPEVLWGKGTRGLLPVGFFNLFPSDNTRMIGQSIVSLLAWIFLGLVLNRIRSKKLIANVLYRGLLLFTLSFALTAEITSWNKIIYSESLSLSFFVVNFALLLQFSFLPQNRKMYFVFWALTSFLIVTGRPNYFVFFIILVLFLIAHNHENFWRTKFALFFMISTISLSFAYEKSNSDYWTEHNWSHELIAISYYASDDNPHANTFFPLVNDYPGKPDCVPNISSPLPSDQQLMWSLPFNFQSTCIEARKWSKQAFLPLILDWWVKYPIEAMDTYRRAIVAASRQLPLFEQLVPLPSFINGLIYPVVNSQVILPDSYHTGSDRQPKITFDPIFMYIFLILTLYYFRRRYFKNQKVSEHIAYFQKLLVAYIAASIAMLISGVLLTPGPQREVYRHAVLPMASLRFTIITLAIISFTVFLEGRRLQTKHP